MRRRLHRALGALTLGWALAGCGGRPAGGALAVGQTAQLTADVAVTRLTERVWVHTARRAIPGYGRVLSNGLLVQGPRRLYLVDTAWDDAQTRAVLAWSRAHLGRAPDLLVVTHAHQDKMGGVGAAHAAGVDSVALDVTNARAPAVGLTPAKRTWSMAEGEGRPLGGGAMQVLYPGAGHAPDNLVVYVPAAGVLHGGCLIRDGGTASLGNTADASVAHWDTAVAHVAAAFPQARVVVPSHGPPGGPELLAHTQALVRAHRGQGRAAAVTLAV